MIFAAPCLRFLPKDTEGKIKRSRDFSPTHETLHAIRRCCLSGDAVAVVSTVTETHRRIMASEASGSPLPSSKPAKRESLGGSLLYPRWCTRMASRRADIENLTQLYLPVGCEMETSPVFRAIAAAYQGK